MITGFLSFSLPIDYSIFFLPNTWVPVSKMQKMVQTNLDFYPVYFALSLLICEQYSTASRYSKLISCQSTFIGMGSNYYGQAMNMGQGFQQQGQQLMNQGRQMSGQVGGQVPSPQQQWQHLMNQGQKFQKQGQSQGEALKKQGEQAAGGGSK